MENKEVRLRVWIEIDGSKFFGPGPAQLLELIAEEGSLAKAAKTMGMSYKKAWDIVSDLNTRGKEPYVISHKGGEKGGGAAVTTHGESVLKQYRQFTEKLYALKESETDLLKNL
ncbi:winged helix-turn-helix domain-containing protein [Algoriphagus halophytocola]|uniref:LysR family transcriptional regulator n=1 Tax=Algoriphagus halophytocola TaxID=2991499 RepID=A0ABY6MIZ2_9BACT|nr:LysR family transcriptional regulator [Algoriphagus sp. TR-M5]UZD23449.1 LysR family transcriptional regulator [Algoriphagus sp. TR-M5]